MLVVEKANPEEKILPKSHHPGVGKQRGVSVRVLTLPFPLHFSVCACDVVPLNLFPDVCSPSASFDSL